MKKIFKKTNIIFLIQILLLIIPVLLKNIINVEYKQLATLCILVFMVLGITFNTFPVIITSLVTVALLFLYGCVPSLGDAFVGYSSNVSYFVIASYGLSLVIQKSIISKLLLSKLLNLSKKNVKSVILIFMICAAIFSSFISNTVAVILFIPFVDEFIELLGNEKNNNLKKCLYVAITVSTMIGGMITPSGSALNLITLDVLTSNGYDITFLKWIALGLPTAILMISWAYFIVLKIFKPTEISKSTITKYISTLNKDKKITFKDKYSMIIILLLIISWIASSWISVINITSVTILSLLLFFIPNHNVLSWDEFEKSINWKVFFISGTMVSLASIAMSTGLANTIANILFPATLNLSLGLAIGLVALLTFLFLLVVPAGSAAIAILTPIVCSFAIGAGLNPIFVTLACSFCVSNCYLLPLDAVVTVTYSKEVYSAKELFRVGLMLQLGMIVIVSLILPLINLIF